MTKKQQDVHTSGVKIRSVRFNAMMNFIMTSSSFLFPLITFPYVTRVIGVEGNGRIAFISSVVQYFSMVAMLGIPTYGIRACARVRNDREKLSRTAQEILALNLIITAIVYVAFFASLLLVPKLREETPLMLVNSGAFILSAVGMNWLYQAMEQYGYITARNLAFKVISIILMFVFVHQPGDYVVYAAITVFAGYASNILNFINVHKIIAVKPLLPLNIKRHIKPVLVFFGMSVAGTIYGSIATVMLGFMQTTTEVGLFDAAAKLRNILTSIVCSLGPVLLPRLSYYLAQQKNTKFQNLIIKAFNCVIITSLFLIGIFTICAPEVIGILSGPQYANAVAPMRLMMPVLLFVGLSNVTGIQILVPSGQEKKVMYSQIVGAIVAFCINLVLIPLYGASGTAVGIAVAELSVLVYQVICLRSMLKKIWRKISIYQPLLALLVATGVTLALRNAVKCNMFISVIASGSVFTIVYCGTLLIIREPFISNLIRKMPIRLNN